MMGYELHLGDCLEVIRSMASGSADFAFVDPPYNVGKDYGEYKDNRPEDDYFNWCALWLRELVRITNDNVAVYPPKIHMRWFWNMLPRNHQIICGWSPEGALRSNFIHQYVPLLVPSKPLRKVKDHWWNPQMKGLGWFYREEKFDHPGQTSMDITNRIIEAFTEPGQTVLDCFMGVGTTGVVCAKKGRNFIGVELNPPYFAIAKQRIEQAQLPLLEVA